MVEKEGKEEWLPSLERVTVTAKDRETVGRTCSFIMHGLAQRG